MAKLKETVVTIPYSEDEKSEKYTVKQYLTPEQVELIGNNMLKCSNVVERNVRYYPYYPMARRTIGVPISGCDTCYDGIDGYYSKFLAGETGVRKEKKIKFFFLFFFIETKKIDIMNMEVRVVIMDSKLELFLSN